MKKGMIAYWVSTALLCLIYASGAVIYIMQRPVVEQALPISAIRLIS